MRELWREYEIQAYARRASKEDRTAEIGAGGGVVKVLCSFVGALLFVFGILFTISALIYVACNFSPIVFVWLIPLATATVGLLLGLAGDRLK